MVKRRDNRVPARRFLLIPTAEWPVWPAFVQRACCRQGCNSGQLILAHRGNKTKAKKEAMIPFILSRVKCIHCNHYALPLPFSAYAAPIDIHTIGYR